MITKAKPIFQEEKEFIEEKLNISLPNDCWIVGGVQSMCIWTYTIKPLT